MQVTLTTGANSIIFGSPTPQGACNWRLTGLDGWGPPPTRQTVYNRMNRDGVIVQQHYKVGRRVAVSGLAWGNIENDLRTGIDLLELAADCVGTDGTLVANFGTFTDTLTVRRTGETQVAFEVGGRPRFRYRITLLAPAPDKA